MLAEEDRHLTAVFLGNVPYQYLLNLLPHSPKPLFPVGLAAKFTRCLFLPPQDPRVVAWQVEWLEDATSLFAFQSTLMQWVIDQQLPVDRSHPFTPHVTLCRRPFAQKAWQHEFTLLPCLISHLHLYESIGNLGYKPIWTHSLIPPFEEIPHAADLAFRVSGTNLQQLFLHAQLALAFRVPALLAQYRNDSIASLEEGVAILNQMIAKQDAETGCGLKAVSYHGVALLKKEDPIFTWEMIVDV